MFRSFVGERSVFYLKCFAHKLRADIRSSETGSGTNGNLNRFHRFEYRSVIFPAVIERPDIFGHGRVQRLLGNAPRSKKLPWIGLLSEHGVPAG